MKNTYPGGVISLQLADAVTFLVAVQGLPNVPVNSPYRVLFKLGLSPNESVPTGTNTNSLPGWTVITPTQTQVVDGVRFFKIKLAGNTFPKSGFYFVTFQFIKSVGATPISLGPAYGLQIPINIVEYQNVNQYTYISTVPSARTYCYNKMVLHGQESLNPQRVLDLLKLQVIRIFTFNICNQVIISVWLMDLNLIH